MTAHGPTIKSFHKRLYTVLPRGVPVPRIRSNSAGASSRALHSYPSIPYCDPSTPPPSSRPGNPYLLSTTRLPLEARTEPEAPNSSQSTGPAPPSSLALTSPHSSNSSSTSLNGIPLSNFNTPPFFLYQPFTPPTSLPSTVLDPCFLPSDTSRHRFHFDVGAYGIPKRHLSSIDSGRDVVGDADLRSHQLKLGDGLDLAVQVGEDAYFVRDNAMGVADGVGGWCRTRTSGLFPFSSSAYPYPYTDSPKGAPSPSALFARRLMHFCSAEVAAQASPPTVSSHDLPSLSTEPLVRHSPLSSPQDVSRDTMEDLADGLDVLLILDRAYERALKSHVITPSAQASTPSLPAPSKPEPLLIGSSTALLAVLDSAGSRVPTPEVSVVADAQAHDAVIRIAHLGDCMGMLVRGANIIWRSEEMWWAVRHFISSPRVIYLHFTPSSTRHCNSGPCPGHRPAQRR